MFEIEEMKKDLPVVVEKEKENDGKVTYNFNFNIGSLIQIFLMPSTRGHETAEDFVKGILRLFR